MPKKGSTPPEVAQPRPELLVTKEDAQRQIESRITKGEQIIAGQPRNEAEFDSRKAEFYTWDEYNYELLKTLFSVDSVASDYRPWTGFFGGDSHLPLQRRWELHVEHVHSYIRRLRSVVERLPLYPVREGTAAPTRTTTSRGGQPPGNKVFVVHGHDNEALQSVARLLSRLKLDPIVLHEQASGGRTIIEKLEHYGDVGFAVILLTPDDVGAAKADSSDLKARARQNVVLELGYFVGRLGRDRVCALHRSNIELPSDILGVVYVELDPGGGWHLTLAREIKAAGLAVDMNNAV